jgi:outer membrane protein OmpA-like peptidoglycan-associated protein
MHDVRKIDRQGSRPSTARSTRLAALLATAVVGVVLVPTVAQAEPVLETTSTSTAKATPSGSTLLEGLSVKDAVSDDVLQVTVSTDIGTLSMTEQKELTLAFGNHYSGDASITFTATPEVANQALATVELQPGDGHAGETAHVSVSALVDQPGHVYSPENEHFYEFVKTGGVTWDQASKLAAGHTFQGQQGYLATIPNAAVNELVASKIEGAESVWFGALADQTPDQPVARTWRWSAGPLAGQVVSKCSNFRGVCDFVANEGLYSSWAPDEPNNAGASWSRGGLDASTPVVVYAPEDAAVTNWGSFGRWNDLRRYDVVTGYLVEYGDKPIGSSSFAGVATSTAEVSIEGVPAAPTDLTAQRGDGEATVAFKAPADNGSAITGYTVTRTPGGVPTTFDCPASPCTVSGLSNGTDYSFSVHATNANGDGPESEPATATPSTVPSVPPTVSAVRGDESATVSFTAPADDGGALPSGYTVTASPGKASATCLGSPCRVTGLTNGTSYTFTVHATNIAGDSEESAPSGAVVPAGVPGAPTSVTAEHGNGSARVSFTAPKDNGSPVTGYVVTVVTVASRPATTDCDESPCTVTGLTNGSAYTFTVHAANEVGAGPESGPSAEVTPATVPDAPGAVTAVRGDGRITLSIEPPASDGGSALTGYEYSLGDDGWKTLATAGHDPVTAVIEDLVNGTRYAVSVRALNAEGHSAASTAGAATPARAPEAPTAVSATRGDALATVSFTAGADNGSALTGFTVTSAPGGLKETCTVSPCVLGGLTNGTTYTFTVVATNGVGESDPSAASEPVVAAAPPSAPQGLALGSQDSAAVLAFGPAASHPSAPVTGYQASVDGGDSWTNLTTTGTDPVFATLGELANGTTHTVIVRAVNEIGPGAAGTGATVTPAGRPSAPRAVSSVASGTTALVTWAAPLSNGGSPVVGYVVTATPGTASCTSTGNSCTVTGLLPGTTYTFHVVADNQHPAWLGTGEGDVAESDPTPVSSRPGAPQAVRTVPGDRTLAISWSAPGNSGSSPVSAYAVSTDGARHWKRVVPVAAGERLRTQLVAMRNGASYEVVVRAVNASGPGDPSAPVRTGLTQWFHDPLSPATRRQEVAVPRHPRRYHGPVRHTTATARSHDGTVAMAATTLRGRKLQAGQAASFGLGPLFSYNSTVLSAQGRVRVKALVQSLTWVDAVTCEGYADYGGRERWEGRLAQKRAAVVCRALRSFGADVTSSVRGYGSATPIVLGGTRVSRAPNRRVVVRITRG